VNFKVRFISTVAQNLFRENEAYFIFLERARNYFLSIPEFTPEPFHREDFSLW